MAISKKIYKSVDTKKMQSDYQAGYRRSDSKTNLKPWDYASDPATAAYMRGWKDGLKEVSRRRAATQRKTAQTARANKRRAADPTPGRAPGR